MAKKNLIILLFIPFLIAILGVVTINTTFSFIDNDIIGIDWDYEDTEVFKVSNGLYPLNAVGVNQKNYPAGAGNNLVWSIRNQDLTDENVYAEIVQQNGKFYLKAIQSGNIVITCSNEKGNVFRSMNAIIYQDGVVVITKQQKASQRNIDQTLYHGEFDLVNNTKKRSTFKINVRAVPDSEQAKIELVDCSDNIKVNLQTNTVEILAPGKAYFTVGCGAGSVVMPSTYSFEVVENGVNVYTYQELLACTNKSENGEIVVLQTSFESLQNMYAVDDEGKAVLNKGEPMVINDDVQLFGTYDFKKQRFDFEDEIYECITTYNKKFIEQWNEQIGSVDSKEILSDKIKVGLRVQKDFYGNGYTINMHDLAFPTSKSSQMDAAGNEVGIYDLGLKDLFRGPLPFYSLGNPDNTPLVTAHGQDNIGVYLDGDNITFNDVKVKNCDFGQLMINLEYVGTVVETNGDNITIKNSELSNGKHVLRSFSCMNLTVQNSVLSNARNFLILTGSNEYISTKELVDEYEFINSDGTKTTTTLSNYMKPTINFDNTQGDMTLWSYLLGSYTDKALIKSSLMTTQNIFNNKEKVEGKLGGTMNIVDSMFYQSGIASIGIDTMFNGPFLYNGTPSLIAMFMEILPLVKSIEGNNIAGMSYPVHVDISGNTKFYDYKTIDQMDISGLITENMSKIASGLPIGDDIIKDLTIDKVFPMKQYLFSGASHQKATISKDSKTYVNVPVAFYGGGLNMSTVNIDTLDTKAQMTGNFKVDLLDSYLSQPGISVEELFKILDQFSSGDTAGIQQLKPVLRGIVLKCVTVVIGYEPFEFICYKSDDLYGQVPQIKDLILNLKGDKENENN